MMQLENERERQVREIQSSGDLWLAVVECLLLDYLSAAVPAISFVSVI